MMFLHIKWVSYLAIRYKGLRILVLETLKTICFGSLDSEENYEDFLDNININI